MNKTDLINKVAAATGVTKADTRLMVNAVFNAIESELVNGKQITLPGFGTLYSKTVKAHETTNPLTGERVQRNDHCKFYFRPAAELKRAANP